MTNKDLNALLSQMKDAPELGGGFGASGKDAAWKDICARARISEAPVPSHGFGDVVSHALRSVGTVALRPAAAMAGLFAIILGGWVATVNASFDTVPGDTLYPVKLATERIQITFAGTSQRKAKLHAEFAGRRLQEAGELTRLGKDEHREQVKEAVEGFRREIGSATAELAGARESASEAATEIAIVLEQKAGEFESLIEDAGDDADEQTEEVSQALDAVQETSSQAIDVLVQDHEEQREVRATEALERRFRDEYKDLRARIALGLGRLDAIEAALAEQEGGLEQIEGLRASILSQNDPLNEAANQMALGGFRGAFDMISQIEAALDTAEARITSLEILITAGEEPEADQPEADEPEPEEGEPEAEAPEEPEPTVEIEAPDF